MLSSLETVFGSLSSIASNEIVGVDFAILDYRDWMEVSVESKIKEMNTSALDRFSLFFPEPYWNLTFCQLKESLKRLNWVVKEKGENDCVARLLYVLLLCLASQLAESKMRIVAALSNSSGFVFDDLTDGDFQRVLFCLIGFGQPN